MRAGDADFKLVTSDFLDHGENLVGGSSGVKKINQTGARTLALFFQLATIDLSEDKTDQRFN